MPGETFLLDANILLLLVTGLASPSYIAIHKRLRAYSTKDHVLLQKLLSTASGIVVTPNIVTETSNLARYTGKPVRGDILRVLRALLHETGEIYIESRVAAGHPAFPRLGLTDAALLQAEFAGHVLLAADLDL